MSKEIYISSTPHETRLAIVEDEALTEIYYERENEYTLAGSIYNGRVTRVLPGMQSSFVDIGLERDAFLYITDFMEEAPDSDEFDTAPTGDRAPRTINAERELTPPPPHRIRRSSDRGDRGGRGRRGGRDRDRNQDRNPDRQTGSEAAPTPARLLPAPPTPTRSPPRLSRRRRDRRRRSRRRWQTAAGADAADAVADAAHPASPPIRTSRTLRRQIPKTHPPDEPRFDPELRAPIESASHRPSTAALHRGRARRMAGEQPTAAADGQRSDAPRRDSDQRPDQRPRVPRGFTPSRDRYGVDSGETSGTGPIANAYPDADSGPAAEPMILPGESLSKYRKGEEPAAAASTLRKRARPLPASYRHARPAGQSLHRCRGLGWRRRPPRRDSLPPPPGRLTSRATRPQPRLRSRPEARRSLRPQRSLWPRRIPPRQPLRIPQQRTGRRAATRRSRAAARTHRPTEAVQSCRTRVAATHGNPCA